MITELQGHFSSETPTSTGTFSVKCIYSYSTAGQTMNETEKDLGEISAVTVPLGQLPADCSMRILKSFA